MTEISFSPALPSLSSVLDLAEFRSGSPRVLAGKRSLKNPVRWVHVLADPSAISLLDGGELVLTTGSGWKSANKNLKTLAQELVKAGVAGLALELGQNFDSTPRELIEVFKKHGIPLIELSGEVRFVQITQRVHSRIISAHTEALEARDEVHRMLTELGLNKSPVDYMIQQMSITLGAPVVLENIAGNTVAWASNDLATGVDEILSRKNQDSVSEKKAERSYAKTSETGFEKTISVSVEARGRKFGTLTALAGPPHPAGRQTVLELGALALALGRLSDTDGDDWLRLSSKRIIDTLLSGRYRHDFDLETQLEAAGLPMKDRDLLAITLTGTGDFGSHESLERAVLETAARRAVAPKGKIIIADAPLNFLAPITADSNPIKPGPVHLMALVSLPLRSVSEGLVDDTPVIARELSRELDMLVPTTTPAEWRAHLSIGGTGHGVSGLLVSAEVVQQAGLIPPWKTLGRVAVQKQSVQPLGYLLRGFQGSDALQHYVQDMLGPLIQHDSKSGVGHTGDLLSVLEAYLAHPTNRTLAAKQARLSRSVFYQRLEAIESLLGLSLAEGENIAALAVAVTAFRL